MTREEMIKKLSEITVAAIPTCITMDMGLEFDYITAEGAGTLFGGMGEWTPYQFNAIEAGQWAAIRSKLEDGSITEQDFDGTDISYIIKRLHSLYGDLYDQFYKNVADTFAAMLELPEVFDGSHFFCLLDVRSWGDKPTFYADEQSLKEAFRDQYCSYITKWEEMDDEELQSWFARLEDDLGDLAINVYSDSEDEEE